jgi:hypothetical protein
MARSAASKSTPRLRVGVLLRSDRVRLVACSPVLSVELVVMVPLRSGGTWSRASLDDRRGTGKASDRRLCGCAPPRSWRISASLGRQGTTPAPCEPDGSRGQPENEARTHAGLAGVPLPAPTESEVLAWAGCSHSSAPGRLLAPDPCALVERTRRHLRGTTPAGTDPRADEPSLGLGQAVHSYRNWRPWWHTTRLATLGRLAVLSARARFRPLAADP